jgi:hypothetical protein
MLDKLLSIYFFRFQNIVSWFQEKIPGHEDGAIVGRSKSRTSSVVRLYLLIQIIQRVQKGLLLSQDRNTCQTLVFGSVT